MCGIAGLIVRQSESLGTDLINMLKELVHRGRDATGVALYEIRDDVQARVTMPDPAYEKDLLGIIQKYGRITNSNIYKGGGIFTFYNHIDFFVYFEAVFFKDFYGVAVLIKKQRGSTYQKKL